MANLRFLAQHYTADEQPFIEKIMGYCQQVEDRYTLKLTDFLNPRELQIVKEIAAYFDLTCFTSDDFDRTEYGRAIIAPDYYVLNRDDFEIVRLEVQYSRQFHQLTHSQVLGALIHQLGVERPLVGDIWIDDGRIQFFIAKHLADYAILSMTKIGKSSVHLAIVKEGEEIINQEDWKTQFVLLASLRIDTVLSTVLNISRSSADKLIQAGKVKVNYRLCLKSSQPLVVHDRVSVRGYGRFHLMSEDGFSKSGKSKMTVETMLRRRRK